MTLSALGALACGPASFRCPDGFALTGEGRCVMAGSDAGPMRPGDGGTLTLAVDSGVDAGLDAFIGLDGGPAPTPDAYVELPDAAVVELPDGCGYGTWYADADHDGYGDASAATSGCMQPAGTVTNMLDCDDTTGSRHPGATETCNGVDDDCDGSTDEGVMSTYYRDADGDGHGATAVSMQGCTAPSGFTSSSDDCNDGERRSFPGNAEVCDGVDNDCDGTPEVLSTYYGDGDHDGHGAATIHVEACTTPAGFVTTSDDCNDAEARAFQGNPEVCDGVDNDCSGVVDQGLLHTYYADCDGDGFSAQTSATPMCPPSAPPACATGLTGHWLNRTAPPTPSELDCSDTDALRRPDNRWFPDCDTDGYVAAAAAGVISCDAPAANACTSGTAAYPHGIWTRTPSPGADCADSNSTVHPGQAYFFNSPYTTPTGPSYDYNCDGMGTPSVTAFTTPPPGQMQPVCSGVAALGCRPSAQTWWGLPPCGSSGTLYTCGASGVNCAVASVVNQFAACH